MLYHCTGSPRQTLSMSIRHQLEIVKKCHLVSLVQIKTRNMKDSKISNYSKMMNVLVDKIRLDDRVDLKTKFSTRTFTIHGYGWNNLRHKRTYM